MILLQYEKVGKTFQDQEIKKETKQQFYTTGILKQEKYGKTLQPFFQYKN